MTSNNEKEIVMNVANQLARLVNMYEAEGVKVYFQDESSFCVKVIKEGKVVKCIRHGNESFDVKKER